MLYSVCVVIALNQNIGEQRDDNSFVGKWFSNWKESEPFDVHVRGPNSHHNQAWKKYEALMNQKQKLM